MSTEAKEFGKWRSLLWPIHAFELKKLLPMLLLFFFISFNYTILRDTKDSLLDPKTRAATIVFLKFWGVVPAAFLFLIIFSKLSNMLSKEALFYSVIAPFLIFFGLYAFYIYPNREWLHPTTSADWLEATFNREGFKGLIACYRYWTFSAFYILSELWGSVVLSLMFWGFANDITRVTEAKRFYSLFGIGANVALLFSGETIVQFSDIRKYVPEGVDPWGMTLKYLMSVVVVFGLFVMAIYWWMNRNVLTDPRFYDQAEKTKMKKEKPKMGIFESFSYLVKSKYLFCLAVIVMAYGISINLVEVTWKDQLTQQFPDKNDYNAFMGRFSQFTGIVTILMMLFLGGNLIRMKGWKFSALVTPTVLLITGVAFFAFIIFRDRWENIIFSTFGTTTLWMAVLFGMAQNIMSKSCKYSLFDPTKEMAYIPLDQEQKVKGKAAVDVVGARLGKSGGSMIQQGLIVYFGTVAAYTPYVAGALLVCIIAWMYTVTVLNKQFLNLTASKNPSPTPAKA
jgi:AAA family ATP:ADP antiporter